MIEETTEMVQNGIEWGSVSDWVMVVITIIYVVATVAIWWANHKSAKASTKQLEESINQYEDNKRLSMMPCFQVQPEIHAGNSNLILVLDDPKIESEEVYKEFTLRNIGLGTAKNIKYIWINFVDRYKRGDFVVSALQSGESTLIKAKFLFPTKELSITDASIELYYQDLLDNNYKQIIKLDFSNRACKLECLSPILLKKEESYDNV